MSNSRRQQQRVYQKLETGQAESTGFVNHRPRKKSSEAGDRKSDIQLLLRIPRTALPS